MDQYFRTATISKWQCAYKSVWNLCYACRYILLLTVCLQSVYRFATLPWLNLLCFEYHKSTKNVCNTSTLTSNEYVICCRLSIIFSLSQTQMYARSTCCGLMLLDFGTLLIDYSAGYLIQCYLFAESASWYKVLLDYAIVRWSYKNSQCQCRCVISLDLLHAAVDK